jgi:diacylglycerol kinase family enzyme
MKIWNNMYFELSIPIKKYCNEMKKVEIIYNPSSGEANHSSEALLQRYSRPDWDLGIYSVDEEKWEELPERNPEKVIVAGGDGTVKRVALLLLTADMDIPLVIHPLGTANNISRTFGRVSREDDLHNSIKFDVGKISGFEEERYFIESIGFGVFPNFVRAIKNESEKDSIKRNKKELMKYFMDIISAYKARKSIVETDKIKLKGKFLMLQVFNTRYLGANMNFAPESYPDDGYFDVRLIPAKRKASFLEYISQKYLDESDPGTLENLFLTLRCKKLKIKSKNDNFHIDDGLFKNPGGKIKIRMIPGRLHINRTPL